MSRSRSNDNTVPRRGARPSLSARRGGYVAAALIDGALLVFIHVWPGWQVVPFLTTEIVEVLPAVNATLVVGIAAHTVYVLADPPWLRALGDIIVTGVGVVALVTLWRVFPFVFSEEGFDWTLVVRVMLALGVLGSVVAMIVSTVELLRPTTTDADRPGPVLR
ncbi:hypothetical protein ABIE39_002311 [Cellulosimicrobium sp. 4261]